MRCIGLLLLLVVLAGCGSSRWLPARAIRHEIESSPVFARSFTGFTLLDAATGRTLCDVNGAKYFTPASNTKIFTLYTVLHVLGDSLPGLRSSWPMDDSLYLWPTGDPTFLHPYFQAWQPVYRFLRRAPAQTIVFNPDRGPERLGEGWAWDDVEFSYSAERTVMPIYGNTRRVFVVSKDSLAVEPRYWEAGLVAAYRSGESKASDSSLQVLFDNRIFYGKGGLKLGYDRLIPVHYAALYLVDLLSDTLHRDIDEDGRAIWNPAKISIVYSCPVDTVYRRMMWQSDNFLAEQLLLCSAVEKFQPNHVATGVDYFNEKSIIQWAKDSLLAGAAPRWVDGSGLSRYNLATPQSLAAVLLKLWQEQPRQRLFNLFPANGQANTTLDWFKTTDPPFVYAKTGSMSGVQCLSGYLVAESGRVLIFSFMNNNFVGPGKPWRLEMQRVLEWVRDRN
jgi:D-alanyl-D-alanine carboxypeptidase/D-alanyl-D-alanine-endopeptidase (penicillin-binding protein 4)